jgi:hypothetical protein
MGFTKHSKAVAYTIRVVLKGHSYENVFEIIPFNQRLGPHYGTTTLF